MADKSIFDQVANEIADWIEYIVEELSEGILAGGLAPFAADLTAAEKEEFYTTQFFNKDLTPNVPGREQMLEEMGITDYARTLSALNKKLGMVGPAFKPVGPAAAPLPDVIQPAAPPQPQPAPMPQPQMMTGA